MAVTENSYTGNGSTTNYSFTFPYLKSTDVQVQVDAAVTTAWTFANATTVQFNTAPANGAKIKILRDTNVDSLAATFYAGSAIKSEDLNDNYTQNLYKTQEVGNRYFSTTGGTMTGDLTLGEDVTLTFEGATDNAHETKLTVADPTADRTITLPNVTGTVVTTGDTGTVAHAMLAGDAVDGDNIANDSINSEHYIDGSIDTQHIADSQVTTAKIADSNVTTAKIADSNVTTAKIANDAINGTKIADDSINSEHYVDASIDTAHIADAQVTTAKIANDAVTADKIANTSVTAGSYTAADITVDAQGRVTAASSGAIATSEITDGAVTTAKLGADSVTGAKIADDSVDSEHLAADSIDTEHYAAGSVDTTALGADAVTGAKIADDAINSEHYTDGSIDTAHIANLQVTTAKIAADAITNAKIADDQIDSEHYVDGSIDTAHIASAQVTDAKLATNSVTTGKITDSNVTTAKIADSNVTLAKLASDLKQTSISDSDTQIPTSGAVVDYVAAQIAPLGGLEVVATEVAFPNTQPAAGVVISISDAGGVVFNGSGVSTTGRTVGGSTVTINGAPSSLYSETLAAGVGLMVSSTGSSQTYNYHKILGKEDDIKQLSDDINDFNSRYRVASSAPTSSKDDGDLWFDTTNGKMMVYNATNTAWEEVSAIGSFLINTISSSSSTGGGSATLNGTAYRFTLSNPPQDAQQLLVSINGVIQKPNAGSSQPSEGFVVSGNDIIFSDPPASGSDYFIITLGQSVQIGTPSDGTVSTAKLANGAVTTAKLADANVTQAKLADQAVNEAKLQISNSPTNGYFLSAQSGNTGGLTWAQVTTDLVGDTSPQLGGDLQSNGNDIDFADNDKAIFGTGGDLEIYHDSSSANSFITETGAGSLVIKANDFYVQNVATETMIKAASDGAVELYHNNSKKFETFSWGIQNYGNVAFRDSDKATFGAGEDLQIYHSGSHSFIDDTGSGDMYIRGDNALKIQNAAGSEQKIVANTDGSVDLYYNGSKRLETDSDGITVTNLITNGEVNIMGSSDGNKYLDARVGSDSLQIRATSGGDSNHTNMAKFFGNGAVELYHNNSKELETTADGIILSGASDISHSNADNLQIGTGSGENGLTIYSGTSDSGSVYFADGSSASAPYRGFVEYNHNNDCLYFGSAGTTAAYFDNNQHFMPNANNSRDLGSASARWRNLYTNDLHLSNEGSSNDVDGSWGNWTIQEGESDLFLKNNRSGKKYKFNLTEVS